MINLDEALAWKSATAEEAAMLEVLQGNILKGHGRRVTRHLFVRFKGPAAQARQALRNVEPLVISAAEQLRQAEVFKATGQSGGPFVAVLLTADGYRSLGLEAIAPTAGPAGQVFDQGMRARRELLNDPPKGKFDKGYRGPIHAMILLAGDPDSPTSWTSSATDDLETRILNIITQSVDVVASEAGRAIFNAAGEGLEHFGYVDGRSQPLLLVEDVERERDEMGGIDLWNPRFPLKQVLVKDPGSAAPEAFGSYFVFRKLEQNVKAFQEAEEELSETLGNDELAGAMLVGRWEDGTAVLLSGTGGQTNPISNNFNYDSDGPGAKCPLHGHVRKTNPRGESAARFGFPVEQERAHLMARRGITYGRRNRITEPDDAPSGGVGLLFMAYQSNLANQFEFTQASWANNDGFLSAGVGRDPIIGQPPPPSILHNALKWNDPGAGLKDAAFGGFVTVKGGEYFFAPSKLTLRSL